MGNRTIAKNTLFLYVRMLLVMGVSLYTSRVILQTLGVDDYGIYQSVGGIVGFLSFLNSALSTGTSRFLAYELGCGDFAKLKLTFSTLLTAHILLAFLIAVISEIIGRGYVIQRLLIPEDRLDAALAVFHISVVTAFFRLVLVPYNACVIAHEKMSFFAYTSIVEVLAQLGIVGLLGIDRCDRLVLYSVLTAAVSLGMLSVYMFYTSRHFPETHGKLSFDKKIFRPIAFFSSWSLFANGSIALNNQGILLLLNMFYSPTVVAARAISLQVNMALNQFINNIRTAVTPPIVKQYAAGEAGASERLCIASTKYSYFLMLLLCFPACLVTPFLLKLWLGTVPEYTVVFVRLIIVQSLFQAFDSSLYTALYAVGRLKGNALLSPLLGFIQFPVIFIMFKMGYSPVVLSWSNLIVYALLGLIVKPVLATRVARYDWRNLYLMYKTCMIVTLVASPIPLVLYHLIESAYWQWNVLLAWLTFVLVAASVYVFGIDKDTRRKVHTFLRKKSQDMLDDGRYMNR